MPGLREGFNYLKLDPKISFDAASKGCQDPLVCSDVRRCLQMAAVNTVLETAGSPEEAEKAIGKIAKRCSILFVAFNKALRNKQSKKEKSLEQLEEEAALKWAQKQNED